MGIADLHIHTRYGDGMATVPELLDYVGRRGDIDVIAVTLLPSGAVGRLTHMINAVQA